MFTISASISRILEPSPQCLISSSQYFSLPNLIDLILNYSCLYKKLSKFLFTCSRFCTSLYKAKLFLRAQVNFQLFFLSGLKNGYMESLPMQTVCIILSLNILRGQIAKGIKISKGFRFNLNLQNILGYSMATANLNKSEDFVTNTTAASKYIPRKPRISIN